MCPPVPVQIPITLLAQPHHRLTLHNTASYHIMLTASFTEDQTTDMMEDKPLYKPQGSATIDLEVTIVQGSEFPESHTVTGRFRKSSYCVQLDVDNAQKETSAGLKGENGLYDWDESFVFAANMSSQLLLKLYCKHREIRSDHIIGEATLECLAIQRNTNVKIDLYEGAKSRPSGYLTLRLAVAATVTFSASPVFRLDLESLHSLNQMTKIVQSLPDDRLETISPAWCQFIKSFDFVTSSAQKIGDLHPPAQLALAAVAFALKAVLDQIDRDEKIEKLISVMRDVYVYVADAYSMEKIDTYKETLRRLLAQTTECSYFIGDYQKVTQFAHRVVVNVVSNADTMIKQFQDSFGELKIELILGSSLQTAVVSFRILQKVENIENLLYIQHLDRLTNVSWDSRRMCLRGTRDAMIHDLVQWASVPHEAEETQKRQIYVVQGPPGCGKSSIAHSVAQAFDRQKRLGAAIFLDERTKGTIESHMISATLAFQLAAYDPKIREGIATEIKANISLARADIRRQFPGLIVSATKDLALVGPICIVIDGLHNIVEPAEQFELLTALAEYFKQLPPNFRLLLTSRPGVALKDIARLIPDCVIQEITFDDEGIYLECNEYISQCLHQLFSKNSNLVQTYTMEDLHDQFIRRSMGMHFWISTAHKSLLLCANGDESIILGSILSNELPRTKEEAMDHLYHAIFLCIPCLEAVHVICQTLIQSPCPLPLPDTLTSVSVTSEDTPIGSIRVIMQSLGFIKESGRDGRNPLFSVHPSLEDFLTNSRRCHTAAIRVHRLSEGVPSMADICLDWMDKLLRQNICEFDDITLSNAEIPERENRLSKFIPPMLQYSCRNWVFHIEALDSSNDIASALERLDIFLSTHLLEWIECMSLLGCIDTVATSLDSLTLWLVKSGISVEDSRYILTNDGIQFIHAFAPTISKAAMQTYVSAFQLMRPDSPLFLQYASRVTWSFKPESPALVQSSTYPCLLCCLVTPKLCDLLPGSNMDEPVTIRAVRFKVVSHPRQGHELWTGTKLNGPYDGSCSWFEAVIVRNFVNKQGLTRSNDTDPEDKWICQALADTRNESRNPEIQQYAHSANYEVVTATPSNDGISDMWTIQRNKPRVREPQLHTVIWMEELEDGADELILMKETGRGLGKGFVRSLKMNDRIAVMAGAKRYAANYTESVEVEIFYFVNQNTPKPFIRAAELA